MSQSGTLDATVDLSPSEGHVVVAQKEILLPKISPLQHHEIRVRPVERSFFYEEKGSPSVYERLLFWRRRETIKALKVDMQLHLKDGRATEVHPLLSSSPSEPFEWRNRSLSLAVAAKSRSTRRVRLKLEYDIVAVRSYEHVTTRGLAAMAAEAAIGVQKGGSVKRC